MAWQSRSVVNGLLKLGRQSTFSPSSFDNACKLSFSSQILVKGNNFNNFQQVRYNSTDNVRLEAFNQVIVNDGSVPSKLGVLFSDTSLVMQAQEALCQLHDMTGLGWVSTIVLTTIGIRLFVGLPIAVLQQKSLARLENLQPQLQKIAENCQRDVSIEKNIYSLSDKTAVKKFKNLYKPQVKALMVENNCTPLKSIALASLQIPVWMVFSGAVRNIVSMLPVTTQEAMAEQQYRYVQMMVENTAIFDSLVTPDVFALPAIFILTGLINIELNNLTRLLTHKGPTKLTITQSVIPWVLRSVVVGLGVFSMYIPSAVTLYWATSSTCALGVNILLKVPAARSLFKIPKTQSFEAEISLRKGLISRLLRRKQLQSGPAT